MSAVGCAPDQDARAQWLRHTLVLDNQIFLERSPELTAGKFAVMGERPFPFFRGTVPQYARDTLGPGGPGHEPSAFVTTHSRDVLLVGDPHPENIGTFRRPDGTMVVAFNDFDASTYGPFTFDVRRLALGFWIAGIELEETALSDAAATISELERRAAVRALLSAYVDAVSAADPEQVGREAAAGAVVDDLLHKALEDGDALETLQTYTVLAEGGRTMAQGDLDPARLVSFGEQTQLVLEDSVRAPTAAQRARVLALIDDYCRTANAPGEVLGISRRYGAGVSSYPQERYYVLLSGPTEDPSDDILLEAKETTDSVLLPGLESLPSWSAPSNGERVVTFQRALQGHRDDDAYLGWATTGGQSFRVRHRTAYQRGFRVTRMAEKLAEGAWVPADFVEFAAFAGALLGRSHARVKTQRGTSAKAAITDVLAGDEDAFVEETLDFVQHYAPIVVEDAARLAALLELHGMTLGY